MYDYELEQMNEKMKQLGIKSRSSYMRKMALDGYCVHYELEGLDEILRLIRISSNNLNQYAKKANSINAVYADDMKELNNSFQEIKMKLLEVIDQLDDIRKPG